MARTALTRVTSLGSYPATPLTALSADFVFTAIDTVNGNSVVMTDKILILVNNTGGAPGTVTISSVADDKKRKGDITAYSVGAGLFSVLGPFKRDHWMQPDGTLSIDGSAATMKVAAVDVS